MDFDLKDTRLNQYIPSTSKEAFSAVVDRRPRLSHLKPHDMIFRDMLGYIDIQQESTESANLGLTLIIRSYLS